MKKTSKNHGAALITGASEGIGRELAKIMAADGWNLVITARREELLHQLAEELVGQYGTNVKVLQCDLSQPAAAAKICEFISAENIVIEALINNAAFGYYGAFADQEIERNLDMVQVNISSLISLSHHFVKEMAERGNGKVMNVASIVAFQALPLNAIYAATKAFVLSFGEALHFELKGSGVTVTSFCPGATESGFYREAGGKKGADRITNSMSAVEVAEQGYRAMMNGKYIAVPGIQNKLMTFITRFIPRRGAGSISFKIMKKYT